MKIGRKISVGYVAVIILTTVIAALGWVSLSTLAESIYDIGRNNLVAIDNLRQMDRDGRSINGEEMNTTSPTQSEKDLAYSCAIMQEDIAHHEACARIYEALPAGDEERAIWRDYKERWNTYLTAHGQYMAAFHAFTDAYKQARIAKKLTDGIDTVVLVIQDPDLHRKFEEMRLMASEVTPPLLEQAEKARQSLIKFNMDESERSVATGINLGSQAKLTMLSAYGLSLLLAIAIAVLITRSIVRPLRTLEAYLGRIAHGDMTTKTDITQNDEVGAMAESLDATVGGLRGMIGGINQNAQGIAGAAEELSAVSKQLTSSAEASSSQSRQAATAVTQISASIGTFAAGIEEMGLTVSEIAKSAGQAASVAQEGVAAAGDANTVMNRLGTSSNEIGEIVKVITGIAEQTNLLALNATIEAARAGDAGRGFAVVASEVKDLARKTSEATADIGRRVAGIQGDSKAAQEALRRITEIVGKINDFQQSIASAVEEQSATNKELACNVGQVSQASTEISKNVNVVASAAKETASGASETLKAANELVSCTKNIFVL